MAGRYRPGADRAAVSRGELPRSRHPGLELATGGNRPWRHGRTGKPARLQTRVAGRRAARGAWSIKARRARQRNLARTWEAAGWPAVEGPRSLLSGELLSGELLSRVSRVSRKLLSRKLLPWKLRPRELRPRAERLWMQWAGMRWAGERRAARMPIARLTIAGLSCSRPREPYLAVARKSAATVLSSPARPSGVRPSGVRRARVRPVRPGGVGPPAVLCVRLRHATVWRATVRGATTVRRAAVRGTARRHTAGKACWVLRSGLLSAVRLLRSVLPARRRAVRTAPHTRVWRPGAVWRHILPARSARGWRWPGTATPARSATRIRLRAVARPVFGARPPRPTPFPRKYPHTTIVSTPLTVSTPLCVIPAQRPCVRGPWQRPSRRAKTQRTMERLRLHVREDLGGQQFQMIEVG